MNPSKSNASSTDEAPASDARSAAGVEEKRQPNQQSNESAAVSMPSIDIPVSKERPASVDSAAKESRQQEVQGQGITAVSIPSTDRSPTPHARSATADEEERQRTPAYKYSCKPAIHCMNENLLCLATFLGVVLGIVMGGTLRLAKKWSKREVMYVKFPGDVFLNMLSCLVIPLIVSSLVVAIGQLDTRISGKIGIRAVLLYFSTTVLAIILGIVLVIALEPGAGKSHPEKEHQDLGKVEEQSLPQDHLLDLLRNLFPPNIVEAMLRQRQTQLQPPKNANESSPESTDMQLWDIKVALTDGTNILGIVMFSIVLGVTLAHLKRKGKPLLDIFSALFFAIMLITRMVIWLSPVGVLFLVASKVLEMEDVKQVMEQISLYIATVMAGLLIHIGIVVPLIFYLFTRTNPYSFALNMSKALATAFATSSSAATLPITMDCLETRNHVDPRVSRFCVPIGATVNMDGTALYEAIAAIFIAQVNQKSLSLVEIIIISITATAASVGAAGIPQAGLVTMVMVLNVAGLPVKDISLILVVDWMLDRFRTASNVLGDAFVAGIVHHVTALDLGDLGDEDRDIPMSLEGLEIIKPKVLVSHG